LIDDRFSYFNTKPADDGQTDIDRSLFSIALVGQLADSKVKSPEFHADLSRYKEMRLHCIPCKNTHILRRHFAHMAHGAQISTSEI